MTQLDYQKFVILFALFPQNTLNLFPCFEENLTSFGSLITPTSKYLNMFIILKLGALFLERLGQNKTSGGSFFVYHMQEK